jgi:hypothetical protein
VPPSEHLRAAAGLKPLDERLRSEAEAAGKTVLGLETVDEQIDTLDGMGPADQMLMLDSTLQDVDRIESVFANLRDAYLARNLVAVYGILNAEKSDDATGAVSRFEQRLIIDRNRRMVKRMDKLLRQGNAAFVAVGALHLPGTHGIPAAERRGLQVTARSTGAHGRSLSPGLLLSSAPNSVDGGRWHATPTPNPIGSMTPPAPAGSIISRATPRTRSPASSAYRARRPSGWCRWRSARS